jgi:hypothetical protein
LIRDAGAAAHSFDYLQKIVAVDAVLTKQFARAFFFVSKREQQMLRRDVLVLHRLRLFCEAVKSG